jgi:hypothetical protein
LRLLPSELEFETRLARFREENDRTIAKVWGKVGSFSLGINELCLLMGPGVYVLWKGKEPLYIGSAKNVLARISTDRHQVVRQCLAEADWIEIFVYRSEIDARDDEAKLIGLWQPTHNIQGKSRSKYESYTEDRENPPRPSPSAFCLTTKSEL